MPVNRVKIVHTSCYWVSLQIIQLSILNLSTFAADLFLVFSLGYKHQEHFSYRG